MSFPKKPSAKSAKNAPDSATHQEAKEHFVRGVLTRGEAAKLPEGAAKTELPPGVTHEIIGEDEKGQPTIVRRRFSTF